MNPEETQTNGSKDNRLSVSIKKGREELAIIEYWVDVSFQGIEEFNTVASNSKITNNKR